jgi:hypothetical protein
MPSLNIVQELRQNTRLRIGVELIFCILAIYSLLVLGDYQAKVESSYSEIANQFLQLQRVTAQTEWKERAEQAHNLRVELEDKLWISNSKGLAEANFQAWLLMQAKIAQIEEPSLKTESTSEIDNGKLWRVVGKMEGKFSSNSLNQLLFALSQHPQIIVIERVDIQNRGDFLTFTLIAAAYFQVSQSTQAEKS